MYKRILVATDGTELSAKAVSSAIRLAHAVGAELVALKVVIPRAEDHWDGALIHQREANAELQAQQQRLAQDVVDTVKTAAQDAGVQATALTLKSSSVADAVIHAAQENACDLIVMASHGRRGMARILLGSETQHVLTHAHIPVLVLC